MLLLLIIGAATGAGAARDAQRNDTRHPLTRPPARRYPARMILLNYSPCRRRAFTPNGITADIMKGSTMDTVSAIRAHEVLSAALGATCYRDDAASALSVANVPAGTVVIERTTHALSGKTELQVTMQCADGDVWGLATWDDDDAGAILSATLTFIGRHSPATPAGYAMRADSTLPVVNTECADCGGDGVIPATGRGTYVICPTCTDH